jgi:hypothetical protein
MIELNGAVIAPMPSCSTTLRTRASLALHHLFAACRFAAVVAQVEHENYGRSFDGFWDEILHNSLGVVTLTVASIESYANELYFEGSIVTPVLNPAAAAELAEVIDMESILRKYSMALVVRTGKRLNFGITPVQNANALIKLRNAIVHFRPEWFDEQDKHDKLSKILQHKFKPSAFLPDEPIFPRAWASHDFAIWALRTTVQFLDHFYSEAGVLSPIEKFKPQLRELSGNALT